MKPCNYILPKWLVETAIQYCFEKASMEVAIKPAVLHEK
jgi:hypothetical protein